MVHEVNNTTEFKNTVRVTGIDIPSLIIDYMVNIIKKIKLWSHLNLLLKF